MCRSKIDNHVQNQSHLPSTIVTNGIFHRQLALGERTCSSGRPSSWCLPLIVRCTVLPCMRTQSSRSNRWQTVRACVRVCVRVRVMDGRLPRSVGVRDRDRLPVVLSLLSSSEVSLVAPVIHGHSYEPRPRANRRVEFRRWIAVNLLDPILLFGIHSRRCRLCRYRWCRWCRWWWCRCWYRAFLR